MKELLIVSAGILFGMLLVHLLEKVMQRKPRQLDPDSAPPAFGAEMPHDYESSAGHMASPLGDIPENPSRGTFEGPDCCWKCGGGKNHSVHHGVRYTASAPASDVKTESLMPADRE